MKSDAHRWLIDILREKQLKYLTSITDKHSYEDRLNLLEKKIGELEDEYFKKIKGSRKTPEESKKDT